MKVYIGIAIIISINAVMSFFGGSILGDVPTDSFLFGLISVCAIFAGFHSMLYGMFFSFLLTKDAVHYCGTGILEKRNRNITDGIISSVLCIFLGLFLVFWYPGEDGTTTRLTIFLYQTSLIFLLWTIICFFVSFFRIRFLIVKPALKELNKYTLSDEKCQKIKEQMRNITTGEIDNDY